MAQYRKKPVVVSAVQFDGNYRCLDIFSINEVKDFIMGLDYKGNDCIKIPTLEGLMTAYIGDYIIRGVKGEYYPCKPDIFEATYEKVTDGTDYNMRSEEEIRGYLEQCIETRDEILAEIKKTADISQIHTAKAIVKGLDAVIQMLEWVLGKTHIIAIALLMSCSASKQIKCWNPDHAVRGVKFKAWEPRYTWSGNRWTIRPYQSKQTKW